MNSATATKPDFAEDAELVQRIAAHDHRAFEALMRRHNRLLYRTARSILHDDEEAEDCLQEAYLQAYRSIGKFRAEAKLSTWLVRIVMNQAFEKLRKGRKEQNNVPFDNVVDLEAHLDNGAAAPERPDAAAQRGELRALLEHRIDRLPAAFRTVFVLRALEEMSVEEVAALLNIPEATVRSRFFRARAMLRETIARDIDVAVEEAFSFDGERCDRIVSRVLQQLPESSSAETPG
jgi:RNA polymerase sigma-70 factor (ECF subfamily)